MTTLPAGSKVLHLIDSGGLYGAEMMLLALVDQQRALGVEAMILSAGEPGEAEKPLEREARKRGLPVQAWRMRPGMNLREAWKILQWARAQGFSLLHSHGYKFNVLFAVWPRFLQPIRCVATLHGYVPAPRFSKLTLYQIVDRVLLPRFDHIVLVAQAMKDQVPRSIARAATTTVIANGLDLERVRRAGLEPLDPALAQFCAEHDPVVVGVGRLSHEKAFDRLIPIFARIKRELPAAGLVIVGEGDERAALEELIRSEGVRGSVLLPGFCGQVAALMARATFLGLPSRSEGLPITLLEAMSLGLPIAATRVGEMARVLGEGEGGLLFSETEPQAMAEATLRWLADPDLRERQRTWSPMRVERDFSARRMADAYLEVYRSTLAHGRSARSSRGS